MARQSWELLDWPHLCRCLLFARPITFAAREIRTSGHLVETQSLDAACGARHGLHPDLLRRVAWPSSGRIFPFSDETVAVEARSFAREHAWLGGIDGYDHPFDELIYLPAAE
jgi:hypothetical protein